MNAMFTKETLKREPVDFRIGAIISDGMWYSQPKWRKMAKVTEEEIESWIESNLATGRLVQSPTGAKSFRFPHESIVEWYDENRIKLGVQLVDSIFPPRIWDGMTETEGFLNAPLRKIGIVSFNCQNSTAREITQKLRGIAKVREYEPGRYKAYCLNATYVKTIVDDELKRLEPGATRNIYSRNESKRREIVDFTPEFARGLVLFYKRFGRSLVKKDMETIQIFIPDPEDQESQITIWVMTAIEKFDESASVPFSGYLNSVLNHRPYDLPTIHLGKELSTFQRQRSKAVEALKKRWGEERNFTSEEMAAEMNMRTSKFNDMEERHRIWTRSRNATTLTWDENSDEKSAEYNLSGNLSNLSQSDIALAHKMSLAVIQSALNTGCYDDAMIIISQIDASEINMGRIQTVSEHFIQELGIVLGVEGEK